MSSRLFHVQSHQTPCQHIREYPTATKHSQEDTLYLAIKQYRPLDNLQPHAGDVTIIAAHGNGFPKELYEPLWDDLLASACQHKFKIRGIWIADVSHQGESGLLNEDIQGDDPSWFDHSRDLLAMINRFHNQMPQPIVGVGHSMGGTSLAHLSIIHPRLLSTLVLFDPIIQSCVPQGIFLAHFCTKRQDLWPSRASAEAAFRKSKYYQTWDPRVLHLWLQYGLRSIPTSLHSTSPSTPDGATTLTTSKHQEAWTYVRPYFDLLCPNDTASIPPNNRRRYPDLESQQLQTRPFYRAEPSVMLSNLPQLRPSVLYVFAQKSFISLADMQDEKMARTGIGVGGSGGVKEGKVKKVVVNGVGHLLTMEAVEECAIVASEWLGQQIAAFREEGGQMSISLSRKSTRGGLTVSKEWEERTKGWIDASTGPKGKL